MKVLSVLALLGILSAESEAILEVGRFSAEKAGATLPSGWKPLAFKKIERHTSYRLVEDDGRMVVQASSQQAASGLIREMKIDPKEYPIVRWRWKVNNLIEKSNVSRKDGDDYPARIYITFEYDPKKVGLFKRVKYESVRLIYGQYPPLGAINYIWSTREPKGTMVSNAYTGQCKMIVVESGPSRIKQWVEMERNLYEDYRKAFGDHPPPISGIAIMTDTDNTGESAVAYYGDIIFKKASGKAKRVTGS